MRAKVREVLRFGADFVKAFNTAVPWTGYPRLRGDRPQYIQAEVEALVDEAHRARVPVTIHCLREEAMLDAVQAGSARASKGVGQLPQLLHLELLNRGIWAAPRGEFCRSTPMAEREVNLATLFLREKHGDLIEYLYN